VTTTRSLTARDLLASPTLSGARLLGGQAGLEATVAAALLVVDGSELERAGPGAAAVLDVTSSDPRRSGVTYRQYLAEVVCRRLHAVGGRLLVIRGDPDSFPLSIRRVADRLSLPVAAIDHPSIPSLVAELQTMISSPDLVASRIVLSAARHLRNSRGRLDVVLDAIARALDAGAAVVTPEGARVASTGPLDADQYPPPTNRSVLTFTRQHGALVGWCPILAPDGNAALWLYVQSADQGPAWERAAGTVLDMAAAYVDGWLATERLRAERDARYRTNLLSELLEAPEPLPSSIAERVATIGWRIGAWHTGIHLVLTDEPGDPPTFLSAVLGEAFSTQGINAPLVERADGWSSWLTAEEASSTTEVRDLLQHLRRALHDYLGRPGSRPVVAGVGRASPGSAGLQASLGEAKRASIVAASSPYPGIVQHIEELGARRLLLSWYGLPAIQDYATDLLQDLLSAAPELLETVETYLDTGRSASNTAAKLKLHRNTVAQRIRRVESLLGVTLVHPDDCLAVQLACRVVRLTRLA
jgi:PucR family transcriptional regulator, purine catabolism regulatory protein